MVARDDEGAHLVAAGLAFALVRGADNRAHLGGHHVAIGVNRDKQAPAFEREADTAPRGGGSGRRPQAKWLAFELEQFLGVHLAAVLLYAFEDAPLGRRKLRDLCAERIGGAEDLPGRLERQGNGRRRRPTQVVSCDRAHRLERRLREERTHAPRVLALPGLELHEISRRQNEFEPFVRVSREHEPSGKQGLEGGGNGCHDEGPAGLGHTVEKLDRRRV